MKLLHSIPTSEELKRVFFKKGYKWTEEPLQLNIIGIRADNQIPNQFDDLMVVYYKDLKGVENGLIFKITTDPGSTYLQHPMNVNGCAILLEGQYKSYVLGLHFGYPALVQVASVTVIRDADRDNVLDYKNKTQTGLFGINIHHAQSYGITQRVNNWSAGCQVFQDINEYNNFINLCRMAEKQSANKIMFTYTLLNELDFVTEPLKKEVLSKRVPQIKSQTRTDTLNEVLNISALNVDKLPIESSIASAIYFIRKQIKELK